MEQVAALELLNTKCMGEKYSSFHFRHIKNLLVLPLKSFFGTNF